MIFNESTSELPVKRVPHPSSCHPFSLFFPFPFYLLHPNPLPSSSGRAGGGERRPHLRAAGDKGGAPALRQLHVLAQQRAARLHPRACAGR